MRSLIKLTLASLAAVALFAGMASAQTTPKFSGNVGAAFGQYSFGEVDGDKGTTAAISEYATSWESNLRMTMATDKLTAVVRYRARATNMGNGTAAGQQQSGSAMSSTANDIYHEIWWKPADNFSIGFGKFQGQAWSQPLAGTYLVINPIGDGEYWMNWTGIPGIDLEFNAGVVQVGLAISSLCKPSCVNTGTAVGGVATTQNTSSMTPHLAGKVGDIAFRAQLPSTSGDQGCTAVNTPVSGECKKGTDVLTLKGSGMQAGVAWSGMPGVSVSLDIASFTDTTGFSGAEDRKRSSTMVRVDFSGITFGYFSLTDNNFSKVKATTSASPSSSAPAGKDGQKTEMTLRYTLPMGSGAIIPEYRSNSFSKEWCASIKKGTANDCQELANSEIRLIGRVTY